METQPHTLHGSSSSVSGPAAAAAGARCNSFTAERVLEAIGQLYAPGSGNAASKRGAADRYLSEFQRSDVCVLIAFQLLTAQDARRLPPEACLLLASAARRRLQRGGVQRVLGPAQTLQLAVAYAARDLRVAELLVHAAVAQWLHCGTVPAQELLVEAGRGQNAAVNVALAALSALPEEANARELKLEQSARAELLVRLFDAAPKVLAVLGSSDLGSCPAGARLGAAAKWCMLCDLNSEALSVLAASPLLGLAGDALVRGQPDCGPAVEFLEVLLERSGCLDPCPEQLVDALLRVLLAARPTGAAERDMLCSLVASAVRAWSRFFIKETAPSPAWVSLLEALVACSAFGHSTASATLSTWLALREQAVKVGAGAAYAPVLASAVRALRTAAAFPPGYVAMAAEAREDFVQYRRELRDALRAMLVEPDVRLAFVEELCSDISMRLTGPWEPLEEAVHALSTPAGAICKSVVLEQCNVRASSVVLDTLSALAADGSPIFAGNCHRQLACTFIMCASVYAALFSQATAGPSGSLTARVLVLARQTLRVRECPPASAGEDSAFPFTVKQDHIGVVCLLRLCSQCAADPAMSSQETLTALCADVRTHLSAGLTSGSEASLEPHSTVVLAEAVACLAAHHARAACELLTTCLELAAEPRVGGAALALLAAAEVVIKCGAQQGQALALALAPAWASLGDSRLDATALARLLSALAEHGPTDTLGLLAQLLAGLIKSRPDARAPLLKAATSFIHRAAREHGAVPLAAELLGGISTLAWAEADQGGRLVARLQLVTDAGIREEEAVAAGDRALIEAWAQLVHQAAKHAPAVLACPGTGLALAVSAAASLVAAPAREPPASSLALLSLEWGRELGAQHREALAGATVVADAAGPWPLGAVVLRAVMKALLGQMPPNALGVLVPAARAVFQHEAVLVEGWVRRALSGDGFPAAGTKPEAKERFVKELLGAHAEVQKFKQALKRICGGKKKGC